VIRPEAGFRRLLEVLDQVEVQYYVTGSLASSIHGIARLTADVDFVADFRAEHIDPFVSLLSGEFYVDAAMIRDALRRGRSFNVIHFASAYKFDFFPLRKDAFSLAQFERRKRITSAALGEPTEMSVATAEDIVLSKLAWFRDGGEVSSPQWRDILGVLKARQGQLDLAYVRRWAGHLKLSDLLEEALKEANYPQIYET
jgi:hypothetical protein